MDFLLDEGAGAKKVARLLRQKGYNVKSVNEGELRGMKDLPVLKIAVEEGRLVVTTDKLFGTAYAGKQYAVIIIDDKHTVTPEFAERLAWAIEYIGQKPELLHGISLAIEQPTPYGSWKLYSQDKSIIVEGLNYFVQRLQLSSHIEMISIPVEVEVVQEEEK